MADPDTNSTNGSTDSSSDSLNGSWVKLDPSTSLRNGSEHPFSVHDGQMEDLLAEAVVEDSRTTAGLNTSTRDSKLPLTLNEVDTAVESNRETHVLPPELPQTDQTSWVEDWSSRVESHPPRKWKLTYPPRKQPTCSGEIAKRKSNFVQVNLYVVIPTILLTHIIAFGIGFYLGRRSSTGSTTV